MNTIGTKGLAEALGMGKSAIHTLVTRSEFPAPTAAESNGGRPEKRWRIPDLPGALTIKGCAVAIREPAQQWALQQAIAAVGAAVPPAPTLTNPPAPVSAAGALPAIERPERPAGFFIPTTERQDRVEWARGLLLAELNRLMAEAGCSQEAAITTLLTSARVGKLEAGKLAMLKAARDPRGKKGAGGDEFPSPRTIKRFIADQAKGKRLVPAVVAPDMAVKPWHALAVPLRQRPQGGCIKWIHEQIVAQWQPAWGAPVGYDAVARFFRDKFSALDQIKGRWTGSQLRARTFYQHRSSAGMQPWDEIHADGWNTHFTAPHPVTAEYVTYEVWHAHDVATRYVPPFGIGLTENFEVIMKCVENAYRAGGCMAFLQTDSTRIVKLSEKFKTNPATAIADRAGFTIVHPQTVGNSQANGIAENFNTWLDRESRELATYQNPKRMDELSFVRGRRLTAQMVRAAKAGDVATMHAKRHELERTNKGLVLTSYEQTIAWLEEKRQKWNHRPHRSLPKVRCAETGKLRHQTPFEALMQHIEAGWEAVLPELPDTSLEQHLVGLFRPHIQLKVRRGTVTPYGGMRYRHAALNEWLDKDVVVAYDMTDWRQVWVKTLKGEPICVADFVEATGYRTFSAKEAAEEKRTAARIRHKERQIEAERQAQPGLVVEHRPAILDYLPAERAPEPQLADVRLIDLLPAKTEGERELTFEETCALYMRREEEDGEGEAAPKEAAAG